MLLHQYPGQKTSLQGKNQNFMRAFFPALFCGSDSRKLQDIL
jgi:hypothetical protein